MGRIGRRAFAVAGLADADDDSPSSVSQINETIVTIIIFTDRAFVVANDYLVHRKIDIEELWWQLYFSRILNVVDVCLKASQLICAAHYFHTICTRRKRWNLHDRDFCCINHLTVR